MGLIGDSCEIILVHIPVGNSNYIFSSNTSKTTDVVYSLHMTIVHFCSTSLSYHFLSSLSIEIQGQITFHPPWTLLTSPGITDSCYN